MIFYPPDTPDIFIERYTEYRETVAAEMSVSIILRTVIHASPKLYLGKPEIITKRQVLITPDMN